MRLPKYLLVVLVLAAGNTFMVHGQPGRNLSTDQRVLTGTEWRLVSLGPAGAETDVIPGTTVTLKFGADGRASGSTGCNSYSGTYQVRGDTVSFSRLINTRRACLDQNANQQEQRFLSGLEAANRFRLSSNRLTILSDRGRSVLNFVSNSSSESNDGSREDRSDPVTTLAAYYNAINTRDYSRAYSYWETPPSSFEQFERGFTDTKQARLFVEPSNRIEGAAGSSYAEIPTIIVGDTYGATKRVFAGCYVMRKSNVRNTGWKIYRANISMAPSSAQLSLILAQRCSY